jgi:hypothetical protein
VIESLVLNSTRKLSVFVASRTSRRSFIARTTSVAAAAAVGAAIFPDPAAALACDCAGPGCTTGCGGDRSAGCDANGHSVSCNGLTGVGGLCPPNSTACGAWTCSCSSCSSGVRLWTDCCATANQCHDASSCVCVPDTDGVTRGTCCHHHCYQGGPNNCNFIICRFEKCV